MLSSVWIVLCGGCGHSGGVTSPSEPQEGLSAPVSALPVPSRLRAVWAPATGAQTAISRLGANAVILQPESWSDDLTGYARWSRERGVGAIPYVGQCFEGSRGGWDGCWASVERWSAPLRAAGILWGYQGIDEPANHGLLGVRDEADAYIRARGFEVLGVEWIESVKHRDYRPPKGLRWFGVACYAFQSRTPWHVQGCAEEYARHPEWDTVVIPEGPTYNRADGYPYDQARWEAIAGGSRSIAFWSPESE